MLPMVMWMTLAAILRRGPFTCAGLFLLTACGAGPRVGFVNHTRHTDAQLRELWETAQQNLSQQIDLNPLQRVFQNSFSATSLVCPVVPTGRDRSDTSEAGLFNLYLVHRLI